ncbi:MAG: hypothetical protein HY259_05955, partial [Chloroflexi bacterium]|nr:hypothetical protein [Chloroflexota bacterium]
YLNLPTETPKVDVDAFNGWYLALLGNVYQVSSWRRPFDLPISFEAIGVGLFGLFALGMTGLIWRQSARTGEYADPYMAAAVLSLGMFMLLTQMHERYLFPVIPLLLLSAVEQDAESDAAWGAQKPWPIAWVYLVLSLTFFFNLISTASFVPSLWISIVVPQPLSPLVVVLKALSFVAAIVNVLVFGWLVRDAIARERVNATTR